MMDGWMTCDLKSFSTVFQSRRWTDDNESLCAMEACVCRVGKVPPSAGLER